MTQKSLAELANMIMVYRGGAGSGRKPGPGSQSPNQGGIAKFSNKDRKKFEFDATLKDVRSGKIGREQLTQALDGVKEKQAAAKKQVGRNGSAGGDGATFNIKDLGTQRDMIEALIKEAAKQKAALTYKSGQHTGAMIALFLPAALARQYALTMPDALDVSELHITLAYLGKADALSIGQVEALHDLMRLIADNHPPVTGAINGCGRFCNDDQDGDPFIIIPDLPTLPNLHQIIEDGLRNLGIDRAKDHGFVPHITLAYIPHEENNPFDALTRIEATFPTISLVLAGERYDYLLGREKDLPISKADFADLLEEYFVQRGSGGSGNWGHVGRPGKLGGSQGGGGLRAIGAKPGSAPSTRRKAAKKVSAKRKRADEKGSAKPKNPAKPKAPAKPTASSIFKQQPSNLGLLERKQRTKISNELAKLPTNDLSKALSKAVKEIDKFPFPMDSLEGRNALIKLNILEAATKKKVKALEKQARKTKGDIVTKAQADAPNYQAASTPRRCKNCRFFLGDPGRDWCELFDFTADQDYVCDDWEAQRPDEIPGYRINKSDLGSLTEAIVVQRGSGGSGNWGHVGRPGKLGGSQGGGGLRAIGPKPDSSRGDRKKASGKLRGERKDVVKTRCHYQRRRGPV